MKSLLTCLLCSLVLLTSGCAYAVRQSQSSDEDVYQLYYAVKDLEMVQGGDAISAETIPVTQIDPLPTREMAEALLTVLLDGPNTTTLRSPIPSGTKLLDLTISGQHAHVDLSASYGALSGIALTIADYCITLTLTQLPEITVVSITVEGQPLAYRNSQNFTAHDVLLSSTADVIRTLDVSLYFLDSAGGLVPEQRTLELYEGDTQALALANALVSGPHGKGLTSALPENFSVLSVWLEEGICYLNLPSALLTDNTQSPDQQALTVAALVNSLCSLDSVDSVQILVDGELRNFYGSISIGGLLYPTAP
ncbi:GerMN domain-containing protein [Oscillibacter sp. MSJ-2]|uniref:GerMN domain-containing protein n=1 Tax=Dysosmobacter acutus TaxID=2841504 RepID=A0ABS6FES2_9FIRM|nr:GerMN domain-containing protein [Dysosmobacter acutus]MBU5628057.1 GerMN domain-containing protein [Dysosmobacter acutus]